MGSTELTMAVALASAPNCASRSGQLGPQHQVHYTLVILSSFRSRVFNGEMTPSA